jgi:DNA-binding PadR family transcriptional regulator
MLAQKELNKFLPLSETTFYAMLSLIQPMHGYAIMQNVEQVSQGFVRLGPGTIYGILATLESQGLIRVDSEEERRKCYRLTAKGRQVLREQIRRLEIMSENARQIIPALESGSEME